MQVHVITCQRYYKAMLKVYVGQFYYLLMECVLCFVVLVVRQEWGNIGVGPVAGETRAGSIVGVQVGNLPEKERLQTLAAHLMN